MQKRLSVVILMLFPLCGCGTATDPNSPKFLANSNASGIAPYNVDSRLGGIIGSYLADAAGFSLDASVGMKNIQQIIFVDNLDSGAGLDAGGTGTHEQGLLIGECSKATATNTINDKKIRDYSFVFLDSKYESKIDTPVFKALFYHELSHCLFSAVHTHWNVDGVKSVKDRTAVAFVAQGVTGRTPEASEITHSSVTVLSEPGVEISRITDNAPPGETLLGGLLYPSSVVGPILSAAQAAYDAENIKQNQIMAPYLVLEDSYWEDNWDELVGDLFTSLGGHRLAGFR